MELNLGDGDGLCDQTHTQCDLQFQIHKLLQLALLHCETAYYERCQAIGIEIPLEMQVICSDASPTFLTFHGLVLNVYKTNIAPLHNCVAA